MYQQQFDLLAQAYFAICQLVTRSTKYPPPETGGVCVGTSGDWSCKLSHLTPYPYYLLLVSAWITIQLTTGQRSVQSVVGL